MQKISFLICLGLGLIYSCTNIDTPGGDVGAVSKPDSAVSINLMPDSRDLTITPENSYSDLFLDSSAVQAFIKSGSIPNANAQSIQQFYNGRNFQYAWFTSNGLTEQAYGLWNLIDQGNGVSEKSSLAIRMDSLIENDSISITPSDSSYIKTEISLTQQFIKLLQKGSDSSLVNFSTIHAFLPTKKMDAVTLGDSLSKAAESSAKNKQYVLLQQQLAKYTAATKKGAGQQIVLGSRQIKKGASAPAITQIKKRLQLTDDYPAADTSALFSDSLLSAIKVYQQRHGFAPTGVITDSLVKVLNVPAEQRLRQILINMNRSAWMPKDAQNLVQVNIPSFMLYVFENGNKAFDMPVIVGKEGTNTMMFSGELNQVVFSPYWNVPKSIVQNEIVPAMKKDASYLKKKNMEIVGKGDSIPAIRQLPGNENSLGKVKFLFPNSYDIYLHDTPKKGLFQADKRAYSHGCIRLADAAKMAQYLLRDQKEWTPEKVNEAMNSNKEQNVKLATSLPVVITYYTAWVDENGLLHFRDDIYGHDKRTTARMFTAKTL